MMEWIKYAADTVLLVVGFVSLLKGRAPLWAWGLVCIIVGTT